MDARLFNMLDESGHPIGGVAAPDYDESKVEVVACPYEDSRKGLPMDTTALAAVTSDWPAILQAARSLSGSGATVHRAWRTCMAMLHAPLFHAEQAEGARTPLPMSGGFKVCLGFAQSVTQLLMEREGAADELLAAQGSGEALFERLDRDRGLIGQRHACSGTRKMIAEMWEALGGAGEDVRLPAPWSDIMAFDGRMDWALDQYGVTAARMLAGELHGSHTPWLNTKHGGRAELALRLFPTGAPPPRTRAYLAARAAQT